VKALHTLWRAWLRLGQFLGDILARIVLTIFYFTILLPFGIGVTWFSDPLEVRRSAPRGWHARPPEAHGTTLEDARRQF
jgi:hypothetical protein